MEWYSTVVSKRVAVACTCEFVCMLTFSSMSAFVPAEQSAGAVLRDTHPVNVCLQR